MSTVVHLESQACPHCAVALKIVHDPSAQETSSLAVRYDVAGWARQCRRADCDGPLSCPWLRPALTVWLQKS